MQPYDCGCYTDPTALDDYCFKHGLMECHAKRYGIDRNARIPGECPPCWRERLLSVGTQPAMSRFKTWREGEPVARLAHKGEVPDHLTKHSKVRDQ